MPLLPLISPAPRARLPSVSDAIHKMPLHLTWIHMFVMDTVACLCDLRTSKPDQTLNPGFCRAFCSFLTWSHGLR
jgi:hypothetical protein